MQNVLVTGGTIAPEPWQTLLPLIDAVNIDLKGFNERWYRRLGGDLETVKQAITIAAALTHVEVTTLLIPDENDSPRKSTPSPPGLHPSGAIFPSTSPVSFRATT